MKKILLLIAILIMVSFALSCRGGQEPESTDKADTEVLTETAEETSTPKLLSEAELYGDGKGINMLVGVDSLGRVVTPVAEKNSDKKIGMFYWIWHGSYTSEIIDTSKIIEKYGTKYALHNVNEYNPNNIPHWWGEPLYGYYNSNDDYIIRRHLTLMTYMGVDFIVFDTSNTLTYPATTRKICQIICEMRAEGFNVPQIAYYTHTASIQTVQKVYRELYSLEEYRDAWYLLDGKPLMIAQTDVAKDIERTQSQHAHLADYNPEPLSDEILNFFTFRTPAWVGQDTACDNTWPWIDWYYPPELHGNLMCVSVSSHHWTKYSWMGNEEIGETRPTAAWNFGNFAWGRGYDVINNKNVSADAIKGTYYQSVWDSVISASPEIAFISGWNEWCCGVEYNADYKTYELYDSFNMEYSRDIEMMKGGYGDNFVLQTAANTRKYGYKAADTDGVTPMHTIDIYGDISQWDEVNAVYFHTGSLNYGRNFKGATVNLTYTTPAAVNGIQEVRIASDSEYIYFYIRSDGNIETGGNKVNLFIGTGTPSLKGWNGYEYLLNRTVENGKTSVEKLDADFNPQASGYADVNLNGEYMQIRIPRSLLNLEANSNLYFKLADSVENSDDITDYYVTGRSMPMGRFSYQFIGN